MPNSALPPIAPLLLPSIVAVADPGLAQFVTIGGEPAPGPENSLTDASGNMLTDAGGNYLVWS